MIVHLLKDSLLLRAATPVGNNPFASVSVPSNPFQKPPAPTINQLRSQHNFMDNGSMGFAASSQPSTLNPLILNQPIQPTNSMNHSPYSAQQNNPANPFAM